MSFLGLGRVFTANMTGNVVLLGFALAGAPGFSSTRSLVALAGFALGALAAGRLARRLSEAHRRWIAAALAAELAAIVVAAVVATGAGAQAHGGRLTAITVALGLGMGVRDTTVRRLGVPFLPSINVLTGTLAGLVADSPLGGGDGRGTARRLGALLSMGAGALVGALMARHELAGPLLVAAGLILATGVAYLTHLRLRRVAGTGSPPPP